jgi:fructosamine-3-kinase
MNQTEVSVMKLLEEAGFEHFPRVIARGYQNNKPYIILNRLGDTLERKQRKNQTHFSYKTVL